MSVPNTFGTDGDAAMTDCGSICRGGGDWNGAGIDHNAAISCDRAGVEFSIVVCCSTLGRGAGMTAANVSSHSCATHAPSAAA